jgi:hypothetical protein
MSHIEEREIFFASVIARTQTKRGVDETNGGQITEAGTRDRPGKANNESTQPFVIFLLNWREQ